MKAIKTFSFGAFLGLLLCLGCETIRNAEKAQEEIKPASLGVCTNEPKKVELKDFDLWDYVVFAVSNRPEIVSAELSLSNAVIDIKMVEGEWMPTVSTGADWSRGTYNNGSHFSGNQQNRPFSQNFSFDVLLYDFGRLDAKEQAARYTLMSAWHDYEEKRIAAFKEVSQAYFTLLECDALYEVAQTNKFNYEEHLREAKHLLEAGESIKLDVLKAQYDLSASELNLINASNDVVVASAAFIKSLGLQLDECSRESILPKSVNPLFNTNVVFSSTTAQVQDLLPFARTNAPSIKSLRAKLRASSSQVDYAISDLLPEITLSSTVSFTDPTWNWVWGVKAFQSLFMGYRKTLAVDQAVLRMKAAKYDVDKAEQTLSYNLGEAVSLRDNAKQSHVTATVQVEQALENLQTVVECFRIGTSDRTDFTDAANAYASAMGSWVKSFYAGQMAEVNLIHLLGTSPSSITPVKIKLDDEDDEKKEEENK
ncbi:MAG: TolC family protein [Kiritimatiellae bacterium]|nr:TolC family protein [Kiritimatiellia bacterium]